MISSVCWHQHGMFGTVGKVFLFVSLEILCLIFMMNFLVSKILTCLELYCVRKDLSCFPNLLRLNVHLPCMVSGLRLILNGTFLKLTQQE